MIAVKIDGHAPMTRYLTFSSFKNLKRARKSGSSGIVSIVDLPQKFAGGQALDRRLGQPIFSIFVGGFFEGFEYLEDRSIDADLRRK
jgi:hypothetical protein